ncbi:MAG: hypothetical protein QOF60_195 [Actinomycetota bacterium]|jgi:hypothetical protein|nr:hypothetical protein [Actinomycetota bacterium]
MHRVTPAILAGFAFASAGMAIDARPAAAERGGFARCGESSCDSGAHRIDDAAKGRSSPAKTECFFYPMDMQLGTEVYDRLGNLVGVVDGTGRWFNKVCNGAAFGSTDIVFIRDREPSPARLREQALEHLTFPTPEVITTPPPDKTQLVNLRTWLSVGGGWQPLSSTAAVQGVSVTVTAEPTRVVWDMGTGDQVICTGPGAVFSNEGEADPSSSCTYRWRRSSASQPDGVFHVTATVEWQVSWTVTGAPGGGPLAPVEQSATVPLRVGEAQARSDTAW